MATINKNILSRWKARLESIEGEYTSAKSWKSWELQVFRFTFLFLLILIVPLDWKFYSYLFRIDWFSLHVYNLFHLSRYLPDFTDLGEDGQWGVKGFASWGLASTIALIGTFIWAKLEPTRQEYAVLYYWLRVIVRYRLAIALLAYGFVKLFPLQMPYPSLSNLLTNYGDFFAWKIYFQTVGIAPKYQSFLGFVEILAAFLIFNRRTATFGAGLVIGFLGNVAVANGFYDIGEHVFSTFLVLLSVLLLIYDVPRLYTLLIKEKKAVANKLVPIFTDKYLKNVRRAVKVSFALFAIVFAYLTYHSYVNDPYKIPKTPGLNNAYGYYNVKQFVLNGDTIPYSKTDSSRWQDVVFEKWSTLSINVNRPIKIDLSNGDGYFEKDIDRNYELAGFGGRHYFHYETDSLTKTLLLQNKNKNHRDEILSLSYDRPNDSTLVLFGENEHSDSIHVTLERINKKFLMYEGRRRPVKL